MLDTFTELVTGVFNNKLQAMGNPFEFPHVRFNIELLPFKIEGVQLLFRVEQYKISQGPEPYRIGYFSVEPTQPEVLLMRNFVIPDYPDFATAQHYAGLDINLEFNSVTKTFAGRAKGTTLKKGDIWVSVSQDICIDPSGLIILDRAYDISTAKLVWGSDYGPFRLIKEKT